MTATRPSSPCSPSLDDAPCAPSAPGGDRDDGPDALAEFAARLLDAPVSFLSRVDLTADGSPDGEHAFAGIFGADVLPDCDWRVRTVQVFCRIVTARRGVVDIGDVSMAGAPEAFGPVVASLGVPVLSPGGAVLGALCVFDTVARRWTERNVADLRRLAAMAAAALAPHAPPPAPAPPVSAEQLGLISERRKLEKALEERGRDIERLLGALPDCVTRARPDTTLTYVNEAYASLFGRTADALVGTRFLDLLPPYIHATVKAHVDSLTPENPVQESEQVVMHADGTRRVLLWSNFMLHENGEPLEILSVGRDVTMLQDAREVLARRAVRAEADSDAKSAFVANMSHEIRTPLNGVLGMATALLATPLSEAQRPMAEIIAGAGTDLLHLLNNIIDLSKIEAGAATAVMEDFVPGRAIADVGALFGPRAREKGVAIVCETGGDPARVKGGAGHVRQVVTNLVSNAVKFSATGCVTLRHALGTDPATGDTVLSVTVADRGPGVPDAMKDTIFGRFRQGAHTAAHHTGGAGLGLAISQRLCVQHGGELRVADNPPGGAVFTATFVVAPCVGMREVGSPMRAPVPVPDAAPLRVLVAEDNPVNRKVLRALMASQPVELTFAEDGALALEALETRAFDGALVDIRMPVLDGLTVARRIRAREARRGAAPLPLVACSANVLNGQIAEYDEAGFDRYLSKPISHAELVDCLHWIRERQRDAARPRVA